MIPREAIVQAAARNIVVAAVLSLSLVIAALAGAVFELAGAWP